MWHGVKFQVQCKIMFQLCNIQRAVINLVYSSVKILCWPPPIINMLFYVFLTSMLTLLLLKKHVCHSSSGSELPNPAMVWVKKFPLNFLSDILTINIHHALLLFHLKVEIFSMANLWQSFWILRISGRSNNEPGVPNQITCLCWICWCSQHNCHLLQYLLGGKNLLGQMIL